MGKNSVELSLRHLKDPDFGRKTTQNEVSYFIVTFLWYFNNVNENN